jgi:hypothetical protein
MSNPGAIEAETLRATAKVTSGDLDMGYMDEVEDQNVWLNGQVIWWGPAKDARAGVNFASCSVHGEEWRIQGPRS